MTTKETNEAKKPEARKPKEITFKCKSCGKTKKLSEMRIITCYFPTLVVCADCEKKII